MTYGPNSFGAPLGTAFFDRDPRVVARELLGRVLISTADGLVVAGRIVETEAYLGTNDPGSHAATKAITQRNSVMYASPGTIYVYFAYGNHHMLNLVCGPPDTAGAVLIRALEPLVGVEEMSARRGGRTGREIANGPGKVAAALGVDMRDNGTVLAEGRLGAFEGERPEPSAIACSGRIGLSHGHELELRYYLDGNPFVSRGRTGPP